MPQKIGVEQAPKRMIRVGNGILATDITLNEFARGKGPFQPVSYADYMHERKQLGKLESSTEQPRRSIAETVHRSKNPSPCMPQLDVSPHDLDPSTEHVQHTFNSIDFQRSGWLRRVKKVGFACTAGQNESQNQTDMRHEDTFPFFVMKVDGAENSIGFASKSSKGGFHSKPNCVGTAGFKIDEEPDSSIERSNDANVVPEIDLSRTSKDTGRRFDNSQRSRKFQPQDTRTHHDQTFFGFNPHQDGSIC